MTRSLRTAVGVPVTLLVLAGGLSAPLQGQAGNARRAEATRTELEEALAEIDQILNSPGYSGRVKSAKRQEADLVRRRLVEGDFQAGDQITLSVVGEQALTSTFTVRSGQVLVLPEIAEVSLKGVLRSELRTHLITTLGEYIRNPQVDVMGAGLRLSILGEVGSPGYYTVPAENIASDAVMLAGGPTGTAELTKMVIRRNGREIVGADELRDAIIAGLSLDQLNVQGGDELYVPGRRTGGMRGILTAVQIVTGLGFAVFSISRLF